MSNLIYRKNSRFIVNKSQLAPKANRTDIINALYGAIYTEFFGATQNKTYKNLSNKEKMEKVNQFALDWLKERNLDA